MCTRDSRRDSSHRRSFNAFTRIPWRNEQSGNRELECRVKLARKVSYRVTHGRIYEKTRRALLPLACLLAPKLVSLGRRTISITGVDDSGRLPGRIDGRKFVGELRPWIRQSSGITAAFSLPSFPVMISVNRIENLRDRHFIFYLRNNVFISARILLRTSSFLSLVVYVKIEYAWAEIYVSKKMRVCSSSA